MFASKDTPATRKTVKSIARPIVAQQIPKYKIDILNLKHSPWALSPIFQGMKVTDEKALIMD